MSTNAYAGIVVSVLKEQWPGYVPVDSQLMRWGTLSQIKIQVVDDSSVDPTEESNAVSWGNN